MHEAVAILLSMATRPGPVFWDPLLANGLVCLAFLLFVEWIQEPSQFDEWLGSRSALSHLWMSCALVLTLLLLGARNGVRFIYFQF